MDKNTPSSQTSKFSNNFQNFSYYFFHQICQNFQYPQNSQNFPRFYPNVQNQLVFYMLMLCFLDRVLFNPSMTSQQPKAKTSGLPILQENPKNLMDVLVPINKIQRKQIHFMTLNFPLVSYN